MENKIYNAYCISCKHRNDRLNKFYSQPNVDNKITPFIVNKHKNPYYGCLSSHRDIILKAKKNKYPYVIIFEDDCKLLYNIDYINILINNFKSKENFDILLLSALGGAHLLWGNWGKIDKFNYFKVNYYFQGSHSVIINNNAYDKILEYTSKINENDEDEIDVDVYSSMDNVFILHPFLTSVNNSSSDINNNNINNNSINDKERLKFLSTVLENL